MTLDRFIGSFPVSERHFAHDFGANLLPFVRFANWDYRHDSMVPDLDLPVGRGWTSDAFNLRVAMPGVGDKDFTVSVHGAGLMIRGERRRPESFGEEGMVSFALSYGKFDKTIALPDGLDLDKMKASFHHGVLDVKIPLLGHARARTIPVSVGVGKFKPAAA